MPREFDSAAVNYLVGSDWAAVDITGTQLTLMCWEMKYDLAAGVPVGKYSSAGAQYGFENAGTYSFFIRDASSFDSVAAVAPVPFRWRHQVGVKNGIGADAMRLYLDGIQVASITSNRSIQNTALSFTIGGRSTNDRIVDGKIAHVAIWDIALTGNEIIALYNGLSPLRVRPVNLKGYWPLNDYGPSGTAKDLTPNNNTMTMSGTVPMTLDSPVVVGTPVITYFPVEVVSAPPAVPPTTDAATIYLDLTVSGVDQYSPPCLLIGEGEAQLRWTTGDDFLRWLGSDANLRFGAEFILGTAQC